MSKPSKRTRQIADMIQRQLSIALRQDIQDPRLANVAITDVVISADLRIAKVYFSLVKDNELADVEIALRHATGYFRHVIATHIDLRFTPTLIFYYDQTIAQAEHLSELLRTVRKDPDESNNPE